MRHFNTVCRRFAFACLALSASASHAAEAARVQSFPPDYFTQFQVNTGLEMVSHLPGFSFDNGNPLRGYAGTLGNVLINGKRPASKTDPLWEILNRIPASAVLRIDVINGGADDIDMQGQATVANIVLKPMDLASSSVTAGSYAGRGGMFPWLEGTYSLKRQDKSIDVYLGRGLDADLGQGPGRRTTWYANRALPAEMTIDARGASDTKALKVNYAQDFLGGQLRWNGTVKPVAYRLRAQYDAEVRSAVQNDQAGRELEQGAGFTRAFGKTTSVDLKAMYRISDNDFASRFVSGNDSSRYSAIARATEQIVVGQLSWQPVAALVLRGGVESVVNTNASRSAYEANGDAVALPSSDVRVQETRSESQLSAAWQAAPAMRVEGGWRIERSSLSQRSDTAGERAFVYSKPRLLVSLSPAPSLQLRWRLDREVSQLNFADFVSSIGLLDKVVSAGNPDLVPAKTWLSEGAIEYHFRDKGAAVLSYTHARISDAIDRVPVRTATAVYDAAGNIGDATTDSVTGLLNIPTDEWFIPQGLLKLTTIWKSSQVTDPTTLTPRRLSGEQPTTWKVEFSQDLLRQKASWGFSVDNGWSKESWQVAQRDSNNGGAFVKAFVNYRTAPKTTLALELNNLASRDISYDRTRYVGDRQTGSVDFFEHNETRTQPFAVLSLRQDW